MSTHKFLFLFKKLSKNLFKEQRFVYDEKPKGPDAEAPKAEAARVLAEKTEAERLRIEKEQSDKRKQAEGELGGEGLETTDPIDKELKDLNTQDKFDKFIKEHIQNGKGKGLTEAQVETLAKFAATKEENVKVLFDEFKDKHITVDQFSVETVKIFLKNTKGESDIKLLIDGLIKSGTKTPEFLIQSTVNYPPLLKQTFDSIKGKNKIKDLNKNLTTILADKLTDTDFTELQKELTDKQKGELLSADLTDAKKEAVFQNLFKGKSLKDFESSTNENIVKYICKNLTAPNLRILFDNLETNAKNAQENISKLNIETCKIILTAVFSTIEKTEEASIFRGLERFLKKDVIKTLIEDKGLKLEIRERLYRDLIDKDGITLPVKEEPKPADDKPKPVDDKSKPVAEQPQSGATAKADADKPAATTSPEVLFTKGMELKDIIAKMGDDFELNGNSISWKFKLTVDGKEVISERSFRVSKRFLKELNKPDKDGRLYNTKDKIKLCAYKWLFDKIYKGEMKKPKGVVVQFEESQEFLKAEIERLTKAVEQPTVDKTKPAAERPTTEPKPAAERPATEPKPAAERPAAEPKPAAERPTTEPKPIPVEGAAADKGPVKPTLLDDQKLLKELFFSNFTKVEKTTQTIEKGDYQLKNAATIYLANEPQTSAYQGHFQYFTIDKPEILKLTDKNGKETFVAQAKDFKEIGPDGKPTPSKAAKDKGPGFINIDDIIKGHTFNPAAEGGEVKPKIESEWNKEDKAKYQEDKDLVKDKKYSIKAGAEYFTDSPKGAITSKTEVSLVDNKTREVEGKKYVQVKIEGLDKPVWIERNQILLTEEDKFKISDKDTFKAEKRPDSIKIEGQFQIVGEMRGSDVLEGIFKQVPAMKGMLEESGISKIDYLKLISKYREGNLLPIITPEKQLSVIVGEYKKASINHSFQKKDSEVKTKIYEGRKGYFDNPRFLKDKVLIEAINSDEKWNDLLEKRPPYENMHIDGLEKITDAMARLGVSKENLRASLMNLLQVGYNEKITFEEAFDTFFKDKGNESSFKNFKQEMDDLGKAVEPWQTDDGKAKISKIDQYNKASKELKLVMVKAEEQHTDYKTSKEYKEWEALGKATEGDRKAFYSHLDSEGKDTQKNIPEKFERLQDLKTRILFPIADLLDSLESASIKVAVDKSFTDKYEAKLSRAPQAETPKDAVYYSVDSLMKAEDKIEPVKESEKLNKITISKAAKRQFDDVIGDLIIQDVLTQNQFDDKGILKLVFQLYTIDSLMADKCLQKSPDGNSFILNSLPKNFNARQKAVSDLFKEVNNDGRIDSNKQKIKEISEILDKNKAVVKRLLQVFSKDQGPATYDNVPIDLLGISYLVRALDGKDRRELPLTMSDIGEGKDSLMTDNFLNRYLSDRAAFSEILSKVSETKNGGNIYNEESLKTEFTKRAGHGLNFAIANAKNDPKLYEELTTKYGALRNPDNTINEANFNKAKEDLAKKIRDPNTPLDQTTRALIRVGHVIDGAVEHGNEEEKLSKNENIKKIQKGLILNRLIRDIDDVKKVDKVLGGGLIIPLTGSPAVGIFGQAQDLGGGWKLTPAIGVGKEGVSGGVAVTNGWELSKDGRSMVTIGATAGYINIGGAVDLQIPISKEWNANIGAAGGVGAVGVYGLAAIGFSKDLNAGAVEALKEEIKNQGYEGIDKLIKSGASVKKVADALVALPGAGGSYAKARAEGITDTGLLEMYKKIRESIDSKTAKEASDVSFVPSGGGIFGGVVNGVPVVGAYLEWVVGEKTMISRRVVPGAPEFSDEQVKAALEEKLGKKVEMLKTKASASGDIVYDATSKKMAVLDSSEKLDLAKLDSLSGFNSELEKAHMGLSKEKDGSIRLHIDSPSEAPTNIKVNVDPLLKEIGVVFTVVDDKIIFKGLSEKEMRSFIITRENFHYPFTTEGTNKLSIITIKNNPERSRAQIEQESPNIIYATDRQRPEILRGIGEGKSEPIILDKVAYEKVSMKREETVESRSVEDFDKYREANRKALNVMSQDQFGKIRDVKGLFKFADKFYKENKKTFLELTTETVNSEKNKFNTEQLITKIKESAEKNGMKDMNSAELNQMIIHLISKTFVEAGGRKKVFERNLKFAEKEVFKPLLTKAVADKTLKIGSTVEQMLAQIDKDMHKIELSELKDKDTFEKFKNGTLFMSVVGTMKIKGLRGTPYYGTPEDKEYGIVNFNEYDPGKPGIEGDIGKSILGILSPLDLTDDKKFMESSIAKKIGAMDAMYLVLGADDAKKVTECFSTKDVKPENKAAFEKFKDIVSKVREAQNQGKNHVDLGNNYEIRIKNKIGMGNYTKCTNPTMAGNEDFAIYGKVETGMAAETQEKILIDTEAVRKATSLIIGVKVDLPERPKIPPREGTPEAGGTGETGQEGGGEPAPAVGGNTGAGQEGGGNSTGNSGTNTGTDAGGPGA